MTYKLKILNEESIADSSNDNVDIEVTLKDGAVYMATLFTLENIDTIMKGYKATGECAYGKYFWASDLVIVNSLEIETINKVVCELVSTGEIKTACTKIRDES